MMQALFREKILIRELNKMSFLKWAFFAGRLGRGRVILLKRGEIEIPSDYTGVLYIELGDNDEWKKDLIKKLKNAGCEVEESE